MSESIVNWLMTVFSEYVPAELFVFIISMMPILELRGGLVAAALLDIPVVEALMICIVGNVIPIPFILLLIRPIFTWLKQTRWFRPIVEKLESKAMGKSDQIRKYEFWGLLIFVGIPLPGTGAWTGALIAAMLNISIKRAMPPILLGVCMASMIMTFISYVLPAIIVGL
jgi:uncharacterized membrane protein